MQLFYRKAMHELAGINNRLAGIRSDYLHLLRQVHRARSTELSQAAEQTERLMDKLQQSLSRQYFKLNGRLDDDQHRAGERTD
jgi:5-bromo-4-chloroindolyl phosphate hydrolysis protein